MNAGTGLQLLNQLNNGQGGVRKGAVRAQRLLGAGRCARRAPAPRESERGHLGRGWTLLSCEFAHEHASGPKTSDCWFATLPGVPPLEACTAPYRKSASVRLDEQHVLPLDDRPREQIVQAAANQLF